ncbi:MAG: cytochrome c [Candidatus Tectomicrobia bacterium]|uniref:Cytochrome c n=1 Tax=Tectimicrobiota bacterium TaxID=2528274 RepID=A0A932MMK0_UNCTE|nr:cytochrome c [Candidatus Tectomicrobia bacterium]
MPPKPRSGRPRARALAVLLALFLGLSAPARPARAQDVIDLMSQMEKAYLALIQQVLVLPIQNLGDPPFADAAQTAARIAQIADGVAKSNAFPGDQGFLKRAEEARAAAREAEAAAREKHLAGAAAALLRLHGACAACHKDFRF